MNSQRTQETRTTGPHGRTAARRTPPTWAIALASLLIAALICAPIAYHSWRTTFPVRHAMHDSMAAQTTALFKTDGSKAQQAARKSGDRTIDVDAEQNPMQGAGFHGISATTHGYTVWIQYFYVSGKDATHRSGLDIIGLNMHREGDTAVGVGMTLSNDSVSMDDEGRKDFLRQTGLEKRQAEHLCEQSLRHLLDTLADNW